MVIKINFSTIQAFSINHMNTCIADVQMYAGNLNNHEIDSDVSFYFKALQNIDLRLR